MTYVYNDDGVITGSLDWDDDGFIEHYSEGGPEDPVFFYGGTFSNFVGGPFKIDSEFTPWERPRAYRTIEHFFQACKTTGRMRHRQIMEVENPWDCKRLGNDREHTVLRPDWDEKDGDRQKGIAYLVMLDGLRVKFGVSWGGGRMARLYGNELLATGDRPIAEDSPTDFIWGFRSADGKNNGHNLLGKALMQVREELRRS